MLRVGIVVVFAVCVAVARGEVTFGTCPDRCGCGVDDDGVSMVDCTGGGYREIPVTSIPCDTQRILFKNNEITKLTRMSFIGLRELQEIDLAGNFIDRIESETFAGMPNLQVVNLADNRLSLIDRRAFQAASFRMAQVAVDANPFYCDEDLKEEVSAVKDRVSYGGMVCANGEIWQIRGEVRNRNYEDVQMNIRKNFEDWELALITTSCVFFAGLVVAFVLLVIKMKRSHYTTGEMIKGRKGDNIRSSEIPDHDDPESRKIEMKSEDDFVRDDDDIFTTRTQPPQSPTSYDGADDQNHFDA